MKFIEKIVIVLMTVTRILRANQNMRLMPHFYVESFKLKADLYFLFLTAFSFNQGSWSVSLAVKLYLNRAFRVLALRIN